MPGASVALRRSSRFAARCELRWSIRSSVRARSTSPILRAKLGGDVAPPPPQSEPRRGDDGGSTPDAATPAARRAATLPRPADGDGGRSDATLVRGSVRDSATAVAGATGNWMARTRRTRASSTRVCGASDAAAARCHSPSSCCTRRQAPPTHPPEYRGTRGAPSSLAAGPRAWRRRARGAARGAAETRHARRQGCHRVMTAHFHLRPGGGALQVGCGCS